MQLNGPICKPASRYQFASFDASSRMRFLSAIMLTAFGMLMAVLFESVHGDWTSGLSFRKANGFNRIVGESDEQMPVLSNVRKRFYCMHVSCEYSTCYFVICHHYYTFTRPFNFVGVQFDLHVGVIEIVIDT